MVCLKLSGMSNIVDYYHMNNVSNRYTTVLGDLISAL